MGWRDLLHQAEKRQSKIISRAIIETGTDVDEHNWENIICKEKFKSLWEDDLTDTQIDAGLGRERVEAFCSGKSIKSKKKPDADGNIWESP